MQAFDVDKIRAEFPILSRQVNGKPLVYLDNAATTQKPQAVIDSLVHYYSTMNANVHRGAHRLSDEATQAFEQAREVLAKFVNANNQREVIWTSGTTESINLVANGLSAKLSTGDEVLVTEMEHHANLVTWQQACLHSGASLKIAPISDEGELDLEFQETANKVLLHGHCQQKSLVGTGPSKTTLGAAGCDVEEVDSGCCGMAGSFGYEAEHFELSQVMGERRLLPAVREASDDTTVVAAGVSCRQQIKHGTGRIAKHPAEVLHEAHFGKSKE